MNEYLHPWKLATLAFGIVLLILGSIYTPAPDWDISISIIMAALAYAFAPWSVRVLVTMQWQKLPLALALSWFAIDGSYSLYWYLQDPAVLALMRDVNFPASAVLYFACGILWLSPWEWRRAGRSPAP